MSLQEKIRKVLHKIPYQHDKDEVWAQIEAQLPKKDNRSFPFLFLLLGAILVGLLYNESVQNVPLDKGIPLVNLIQIDQPSGSSTIDTKVIYAINKVSNTGEQSSHKKTTQSHSLSAISQTYSTSDQNTYENTPSAKQISNKQSIIKSLPPLSLEFITTITNSQTNIDPQHPCTDFVTEAHSSFEKVKPSNTILQSANTDAGDSVLAERRSPHVIKNSKLPLSHLQLLDVPKHGFNLLQKIPIKVNEHITKSPWTLSVATLAFTPIRDLKGQSEYVNYKNVAETSDPSFTVSVLAGRSIINSLKGHIGLQYDALIEYHQGKSTTTRTEKINSDSANYYIFNAKPVYSKGELTKTITEGKQFKAPNILQRWSIPVSMSYQLSFAKGWIIEPNIGLCYTFDQRFDGITINEEGNYLIHDKDAFAKLYKSSNLFSLQTGLSTAYRFTNKFVIDARYQYSSDLQNNLQSSNNFIVYRRHGLGVGFSYLIQ